MKLILMLQWSVTIVTCYSHPLFKYSWHSHTTYCAKIRNGEAQFTVAVFYIRCGRGYGSRGLTAVTQQNKEMVTWRAFYFPVNLRKLKDKLFSVETNASPGFAAMSTSDKRSWFRELVQRSWFRELTSFEQANKSLKILKGYLESVCKDYLFYYEKPKIKIVQTVGIP